MSEVLNPADAERAVREIANEIARHVRTVSDAERESRHQRVLYDRAYAHAYLAAEGPAHEKKYRAEQATGQERDRAEVAELAYRHAERVARALDGKLRAAQTVNASVRAMFSGQGSGVGG